MKKQILFLCAAALILTACSSDREYGDDMNPVPVEMVPASPVLNASFADDTRASFVNNDVIWDEGDMIKVFLKRSDYDDYVLAKGGGTTNGLFKPVLDISAHEATIPYYAAIYGTRYSPYFKATETGYVILNNKILNIQTYVENSVDYKYAAMLAISKDTNIKFKNLLGILKLNLRNDSGNEVKISKIVVKDRSGAPCSGDFNIYIDNVEGDMKYRLDFTSFEKGDSVCMSFDTGFSLTKKPTAFHFLLPPRKYEQGLNVELWNDNVIIRVLKIKPCEIERSKIFTMPELEIFSQEKVTVDPITHTIECNKPGSIYFRHLKEAVAGSGKLVVKGVINNSDLGYIGQAAGSTWAKIYNDQVGIPNLGITSLDLSGVSILDDTGSSNGSVINEDMFRESSLKSVILPEDLVRIKNSVFESSKQLEQVVFTGNKLESLSDAVFLNCNLLKNIEIPSSVRTILESCFASSGLEELIIPSGVTYIGNHVVSGCNNLKKITLECDNKALGPQPLGSPGDNFENCELRINPSIESNIKIRNAELMFFGSPFKSICKLDGTPYISFDASTHTFTVLLKGLIERNYLKKFIVENDDFVKFLGPLNCNDIKEAINLPVKCIDFSEVNLYDGIIESLLFLSAVQNSIILPNNTTRIELYAFKHSKIESLEIPASVTFLGDSFLYGCDNLTSVKINGIPTIHKSAFSNFSNIENCTLYINEAFREQVEKGDFDSWKKIFFIRQQGVGIGGINDEDVF